MPSNKLLQLAHDLMFSLVHGNGLVYNTCWEDPRLDRELLGLKPDSRVVVITSAGDNALDYLLDTPASVDCVDVNHRQNALLELKRALFTQADFETLFAFFGDGGGEGCAAAYQELREHLPQYAAAFWDRNVGYFKPGGLARSFYYRGASGALAWIFARFLSVFKPGLRLGIQHLLAATTMEEQRELFARLEPVMWGPFSRWLVGSTSIMALMGVPRPQAALIKAKHPGGMEGFIRDKVRRVFTELPVADNYFWRVYCHGRYTRECCPEYLKQANFEPIRTRLASLRVHTNTPSGFLHANPGPYTHFVLLDHQDWMAWHAPKVLSEEWRLILASATPGAKVLLRSAGLDASFVPSEARARLRFFPELTEPLHDRDRVGTYGSQHLAEVL
ncbi:S-adenosylmethionine:diacylglycerol 3-amino-3-carboxypropyl transferase [Desulfocurvibacter africanus PCS]|uniref:S-adenosylmethionine:diacylglycerol 3-amino-3-carboxypropyl transferase n=1 Tax=Desulfocurvibacter africanus PCS TaxID=1262666 RepID=M5PV22_DESAF|nr:BtaA family protein [Desulfocurvibacter africanus]EMG37914.1 S-adenosylmethionine:diacylglycerol 3-amino-3-carboxypropyl transferase [Desulfocurvibacter africanus PCS]